MKVTRLAAPLNATGQSRLRHKGRQRVCHDTVNGLIAVERIRWWSKQDGCDETIDRVLGIVADHVSTGVRQMCCRVAIAQGGFKRASQHLEHLADCIAPTASSIPTGRSAGAHGPV
jgi:hypothetical protein